jgi:hypothetical protein
MEWCGVKEIKWLSPLRVTKIVVISISILVKNMYAKNKNAYLKNLRGQNGHKGHKQINK